MVISRAVPLVCLVLLLVPTIGACQDSGLSPWETRRAGSISARLRKEVSVEGIMDHLQALQTIADRNDGTRAAGTPGFQKSADYVARRLEDAGYEVTLDEFPFPSFRELSPAELVQTSPRRRTFHVSRDFKVMLYSPPGRIRAPVTPVGFETDDGSTDVCTEDDYSALPHGTIALVPAGNCYYRDQAAEAGAAGASAIIIVNDPGSEGALSGTLTSQADAEVPVLGASFDFGTDIAALADRRKVVLDLQVNTVLEAEISSNVIGEWPGGETNDVVMVGGHLDSVLAGPGINDNGSGTSAILEVAEELADEGAARRLRFAFWSAEEFGLLGSSAYVADLSSNEAERIIAYLNFDMIASPNYAIGVYGPDQSEGSGEIHALFARYFSSRDIEPVTLDLTNRSDHAAFATIEIPVGGLFSGAEDLKSDHEQGLFGGKAGEPHDPCYHQACDDIDNIDKKALDEMSDAIAHIVATLATNPQALGDR